MSRLSLRKAVAAGLGAALIGSGLTVGLGAGVASAEPTAACETTQEFTKNATVGKFTYKRSVVGDGTVAPDGTVTMKTNFAVTGIENPYINTVIDYGPAGFTPIKAWVTAYHFGKGSVREEVAFSPAGAGTQVASGGWSVTKGQPLTVEIEYQAPSDAQVGAVLNTGVEFKGTVGSAQTLNPMDVCVTVRGKNAIEAGAGSLEDMGLGSINSGSGQVFGSLTDPQGSMTNVISGVLGNILGDMIGS